MTIAKYLFVVFSISFSQPCLSDFNNINPWNPYPLNTYQLDSMKRFGDEVFGDWIWRVQERDSLNRRTKASILDYQAGENINSIEWVNYFGDSTEYIIKPAPSDSPLKDSNSTIETYYFTSNHIDSIKRFEWDSNLKMFRDYDNSHFHRNGDTLKHYSNTYVYNIDSLGNDSLTDIHRRDISSRIIENDKVRLIQMIPLFVKIQKPLVFAYQPIIQTPYFIIPIKTGPLTQVFLLAKLKMLVLSFGGTIKVLFSKAHQPNQAPLK
jgi:hypothetical protein